ncbi:MAG: hypothetical protein R3F34_10655 [Planctomycetota bacterium]
MGLSITKIRGGVWLLAGSLVGSLATAGIAGLGSDEMAVEAVLAGSIGGPGAAALGSSEPGAAVRPDDAPAAARRTDRGAPAPAVDPRLLAMPLQERFAQVTPGASNPGVRVAPPEQRMSGMIAALFPSDETVLSTTPSFRPPPPVDPPPDVDDGDDGDDEEETCVGEDCDTSGPCAPPPSGVPELDADLFRTGVLLLLGGALVLGSRRRFGAA